MLTGNGKTITYTSFNKAKTITANGQTDTLTYDANFNRLIKSNAGGTMIYIGKLYEHITSGTSVTQKYYLYAGNVIVGVYTVNSNGTSSTRYFHTDHLGSIDTITDESGNVVQRLSYDAFGKRRNTDWTDATTTISSLTTRGFTHHEMDDEVGLINMNAREYDPVLGRFITPDTIVQTPFSSQGLNRYSYANNNPLSYWDPTGHGWFKKLRQAVQNIVHAQVQLIFHPSVRNAFNLAQAQPGMHYVDHTLTRDKWAREGLMYASSLCGPAAAACAAGAASYTTMLMGGSASDALRAGASAGLGSYANQWVDSPSGGLQYSNWQAAAVYGTAEGVANKLQGGSFTGGFLGSGLGQYGRLQMLDSNLNLGSIDFSYKGMTASINTTGYYAEALLGASEAAGKGGNIFAGAASSFIEGVYRDADNLGLTSWNNVKSFFGGGGSSFSLPAGLNVDATLIHDRATALGIHASGPSGDYGYAYYYKGRDWYDWEVDPRLGNIFKGLLH